MPDEAGVGLHRIEPVKTRSRRRYLHPLLRYGFIISGGAAVAGMTLIVSGVVVIHLFSDMTVH